MTWIGRSIHCASSIATSVETTSAMSAGARRRCVSALQISLRTSSVEMPMRIAPNWLSSPASIGSRTSNGARSRRRAAASTAPPSTSGVKSSSSRHRLPFERRQAVGDRVAVRVDDGRVE